MLVHDFPADSFCVYNLKLVGGRRGYVNAKRLNVRYHTESRELVTIRITKCCSTHMIIDSTHIVYIYI